MTHDELLAEIDERASYLGNADSIYIALRAVVELHKPARIGEGCSHCKMTAITSRPYPCPTIQAIEKELA